jgi:hypothetical protein
MSVSIEELELRMRPGGWSVKPMLLPGEWLSPRLADDAARLERLGIGAAELGARLAELLATAGSSDWFLPRRAGDYDVELRKRRGLITCPWAPEENARCQHGAGARPTANEFMVRRRSGGLVVSGFELSAHLIREHGFFGGIGTVFRIEPEALAALLQR